MNGVILLHGLVRPRKKLGDIKSVALIDLCTLTVDVIHNSILEDKRGWGMHTKYLNRSSLVMKSFSDSL